MATATDIAAARALDAADELAEFRGRFQMPAEGLIYLDGNSLGPLPVAAARRAREVVEGQWGERLIRAWNDEWLGLAARIAGKIARLIGADADEVAVADSTSVNLFKLAVAALRRRPGQPRIVSDELNFPSDLYVLQAAAESAACGHYLHRVGARGADAVALSEWEAAIDRDTALVASTQVAFKSAFVHDMAAITALAHRAGALSLWDLSHSVGALEIDLHAADVDLAVGCTYKYLCGGPGAPAFLFVRRDLQEELQNPITGWFGQFDQFAFETDYDPAPGIRRFLCGSTPIVSLALTEAGIDLVLEAGVARIAAKSRRMTEFLIGAWQETLAPLGYGLTSPRDPSRRGSHVALSHPDGLAISRTLIEAYSVIPDFRQPHHIRLGITPLTLRYQDLARAVEALRDVVTSGRFREFRTDRPTVT